MMQKRVVLALGLVISSLAAALFAAEVATNAPPKSPNAAGQDAREHLARSQAAWQKLSANL
jgi:hypothetical protein